MTTRTLAPSAAPTGAAFDDVVNVLQSVRESEDVTAWHIGDVVLAYVGQFKRGHQGVELERLAHATGYTRAALRERKDTSGFYPAETRGYGPAVSWSHFNRARRGHTLAQAQEWLDKAEELTWSVAELEYQIAKAEGKADPEPSFDDLVNKAADALREALELRGVAQARRQAAQTALEALEGLEGING